MPWIVRVSAVCPGFTVGSDMPVSWRSKPGLCEVPASVSSLGRAARAGAVPRTRHTQNKTADWIFIIVPPAVSLRYFVRGAHQYQRKSRRPEAVDRKVGPIAKHEVGW